MIRECLLDEQAQAEALKEAERPSDVDLLASLSLARLDANLGPGMAGPFETIKENYEQRDGITTTQLHLKQERDGKQYHWYYSAAAKGLASYVFSGVSLTDVSALVESVTKNIELYDLTDPSYSDRALTQETRVENEPVGSFASNGGPPPHVMPRPRPAEKPENMPDPSIKEEPGLDERDGSPILRREVTKGTRLLRYHRQQFPLLPYLTEPMFDSLWREVNDKMNLSQHTSVPLLHAWGYRVDLPSGWRESSSTSAFEPASQSQFCFSLLKLPGPVFHHGICGFLITLERKGFQLVKDHCLSDSVSSYYLAVFGGPQPLVLAMRMVDQDLVCLWAKGEAVESTTLLDVLASITPGEKQETFPEFETELFNYDLSQAWICPQPGQAHNLENHCSLIGGVFPHKIHYRLKRITDEYDESLMTLNREEGVEVKRLERTHGQDAHYEMERLAHEMRIETHTVVKKYTFFMKPDLNFFRGKTQMFHLEMAIPVDDNEAEHLALYEELIRRAVAKREMLHD